MKHLASTLGALALAAALTAAGRPAVAADPIKIGFTAELTGGLANTGKSVLLTTQMWAEKVNAEGGLLGRPVQLIYYDDQSSSSNVPGIVVKLIDVDKVDLLVSGYSTAAVAPAMPVAMAHGMMFLGLLGLGVNDQFHYDRYFSVASGGPEPMLEYSRGFLDVAMSMNPKPKTLAIVSADLEYARTASDGARVNAKRLGLQIVYDRAYPPNTTDFAPIIRGIQASSPDLVYVASYPQDSAGMVRAAAEVGLKTRMFGGGMIGIQYASVKQQLGPLLNGLVSFDQYAPEPSIKFPGIREFLAEYQKRAPTAGVDALGYFGPPYAYARMQILEAAVKGTKSLDQKVLADYIHKTSIPTVLGDMNFNENGDRPEPLQIFVQYRDVVGTDVEQFKQPGKAVVVYPPALKSGDVIYPYSDIKR